MSALPGLINALNSVSTLASEVLTASLAIQLVNRDSQSAHESIAEFVSAASIAEIDLLDRDLLLLASASPLPYSLQAVKLYSYFKFCEAQRRGGFAGYPDLSEFGL